MSVAGNARAATCSPGRIAQTQSALEDSRFALSQVPPHDGTATAIGPETSQSIAEVKDRLAAFVTAYMNCQHLNADPGGIQIDLSRLGWARDADQPAPPSADPYKPDPTLSFDVRPFAGGYLGITAAFGVPCGSDTILMLFADDAGSWREILRVQSAPYRDLAHAYQDFDYALSPLDDAGRWYLVEKHLPVQCGPGNASIDYSLLRAGPTAATPQLLFSGRDPIANVDEDKGSVSADADGFQVRFHALGSDGVGVATTRAFAVTGDVVEPARHPPQE